MILNFDHIAILATDIKGVASTLPAWLTCHELEKHSAEGTLEQYVTSPSESDPSLLLLQPIQDGPYATALKKRGSGLHHLACSTDSIDDAVSHFAGQGLLLHPISLKTYPKRVVWMCRPGIPFLIELFESKGVSQLTQLQTQLQLPASQVGDCDPIHFIPNTVVTAGPSKDIELQIGDKSFNIVF
ncbi:MAG: hypothetical protein AB8G95_13140 [Anaerolineae bacterium]